MPDCSLIGGSVDILLGGPWINFKNCLRTKCGMIVIELLSGSIRNSLQCITLVVLHLHRALNKVIQSSNPHMHTLVPKFADSNSAEAVGFLG